STRVPSRVVAAPGQAGRATAAGQRPQGRHGDRGPPPGRPAHRGRALHAPGPRDAEHTPRPGEPGEHLQLHAWRGPPGRREPGTAGATLVKRLPLRDFTPALQGTRSAEKRAAVGSCAPLGTGTQWRAPVVRRWTALITGCELRERQS